MNEYMLVFRRDAQSSTIQTTPGQPQAITKPWQDWMDTLTAQGKLISKGNRLTSEGRVLKPQEVITNGPYVEIKEAIGGFVVIAAANIDEAAKTAKGCPILSMGGSVEVRGVLNTNGRA